MMKVIVMICMAIYGIIGCNTTADNVPETANVLIDSSVVITDSVLHPEISTINQLDIIPNIKADTITHLVDFAETLIGIPYKYASTDPTQGFDCSGFITYVFNQFKIDVPRSSVDFTNVGQEISVKDAKRGDLILFTGTDSLIRVVGHMGIVTENMDTLKFIHSSSGNANGVVITPLNEHYQKRFVKIIRL